jgi:dTDP-4-dehydrorhamnose 3,5-epimerase
MKFTATPLAGAFLVDIDSTSDERGFFARTFCAEEFATYGLSAAALQCSVSYNVNKGTLRGMHYQAAPHEEDKLIRCTAGAIFDVIVDIRTGSASYGRWFGAELTAASHRALFAPKGFAHGFLTLADDSEVLYMIAAPYAPGFARGFSWNDPQVAIAWPIQPVVVSARDAAYKPLGHGAD